MPNNDDRSILQAAVDAEGVIKSGSLNEVLRQIQETTHTLEGRLGVIPLRDSVTIDGKLSLAEQDTQVGEEGYGTIYFDSDTGKLMASEDGAAMVELIGSGGGGIRQTFRGLHLGTHPDNVTDLTTVYLYRCDEVVFDDETKMVDLGGTTASTAALGISGIDTGVKVNSTWYSIYIVANETSSGLILHREKDYFADEVQSGIAATVNLRDVAGRQQVAQGFQTDLAKPIELIEIVARSVGAPTGSVWIEIQSDSGGSPSGTVLATSQKFKALSLASGAYFVQFPFRNPFTPTALTQYHFVVRSDCAIDGANYIQLSNRSDIYARGAEKTYDGAVWTAPGDDLTFQVIVTQNDTSVEIPSGYTKKCKIGYCYVDSSGNLVPFTAIDHHVIMNVDSNSGNVTSINPTLITASTMIPPGPIELELSYSHGTAGLQIVTAAFPLGYALSTVAGARGRGGSSGSRSIFADSTVPHGLVGTLNTEFQRFYAATPAGTAILWVSAWRWSR